MIELFDQMEDSIHPFQIPRWASYSWPVPETSLLKGCHVLRIPLATAIIATLIVFSLDDMDSGSGEPILGDGFGFLDRLHVMSFSMLLIAVDMICSSFKVRR